MNETSAGLRMTCLHSPPLQYDAGCRNSKAIQGWFATIWGGFGHRQGLGEFVGGVDLGNTIDISGLKTKVAKRKRGDLSRWLALMTCHKDHYLSQIARSPAACRDSGE